MQVGIIEVGLGVNPTELQRGLQAGLQSLDAFDDNARKALGTLGQFGSATDEVGEAYAKLSLELNDVQGRLAALAAAYRQTGDPLRQREIVLETAALREQEDALRQVAQALRQADNSNAGFRRSSGLASNVALEFGRGLGDLRYGLFAVANNAEQLVGQFGLLVRQSGGVSGAIRAVGAALAGPAGIVAGIGAVTLLGPALASFFSDTKDQAEDAAEGIERISDAVKGILDISTGGLSKFNVTIDGLRRASALADVQVESLQQRINDFDVLSTDPDAVAKLERLKTQFAEAQGAAAAFRREIEAREGTGFAANILRTLGFEEVTEGLGETGDAAEDAAAQWETFAESAARVLATIRAANAEKIPAIFAAAEVEIPLPDFVDLPPIIGDVTDEIGRLDAVLLGFQRSGSRVLRDFVDDLSASFGDAAFALLGFGDELSDAEARLARLDFADARERLADAFDAGRLSAERYSAELAVLNERQRELERSLSPIARAFDTLGDAIVASMKRAVAAITEAIAKALILKGLGLLFPTGGFIGNIVEGIAQGGRTASPALNVGTSASVATFPTSAARSGDDGMLREIRTELRNLQRTFIAGADRIAGTYADPHAARRSRALAATQDALVRPRFGVV